jgi:hypothetical protein
MLADVEYLPRHAVLVIKSNNKRRCRVEAIRSVLSCLPYAGRDERAAGRPDPLIARRRDTS